MNPAIKAEWLARLRGEGEHAGKWVQGQCALRLKAPEGMQERYCCLGVLCDIVDPAGWSDPLHNSTLRIDRYGHGTQGKTGAPDVSVYVAAGLDVKDPRVDELIKMNDGIQGQRTHSFSEIADYIEKEFV